MESTWQGQSNKTIKMMMKVEINIEINGVHSLSVAINSRLMMVEITGVYSFTR
jgi:hypothetical protein